MHGFSSPSLREGGGGDERENQSAPEWTPDDFCLLHILQIKTQQWNNGMRSISLFTEQLHFHFLEWTASYTGGIINLEIMRCWRCAALWLSLQPVWTSPKQQFKHSLTIWLLYHYIHVLHIRFQPLSVKFQNRTFQKEAKWTVFLSKIVKADNESLDGKWRENCTENAMSFSST